MAIRAVRVYAEREVPESARFPSSGFGTTEESLVLPCTMATSKPKRRWYQFSLRTLMLGVVLASLLASYVGSYYRLSRRGLAEAREVDAEGFFYVPMDDVFASQDLSEHYRRAWFFAPVNWIDRHLFGGPAPAVEPTWKLTWNSRVRICEYCDRQAPYV